MEQIFSYHAVKMGFLTFNVKEKDPNTAIAKDIARSLIGNQIIVLGFQEIDMTISANIKKSKKISKWEDLLDAEFVRGGTKSTEVAKYMKLASHFMMGIVIIMYIDVLLLSHMHDIEATTVTMGVGKIFGNKGGVAVSFCIDSTSYLVLNCHLLHGETDEDLEKRDKQLIGLFQQSSITLCTVKKQDGSADEQNFMATEQFNEARDLRFVNFLPTERSALNRKNKENLPIFECYDYIFLMGDLNYRVDKATKEDQLKLRMLLDEFILSSNSFEEETITFPPSYKYGKGGALVIDREPSWTDRVLISRKYKQGDNLRLNYIKYGSLQDVTFSDHKAVYQVAEVCYRTVVEERVGECLKQHCDVWDRKTREMHPQLKYLNDSQEAYSILPIRTKHNRIVLDFELTCSKTLINKLVYNVVGLDDYLFENKIISHAKASVTEVVSYLDFDQKLFDVKRSPMGIVLSTYALSIEISINAPVLLPYLKTVYSVQHLAELLDKQISLPLLVTIDSNTDSLCLYKDMTVPFFIKLVDHVSLYRDDMIGLMNLPLYAINATTLEVRKESMTKGTLDAIGDICVESNDPSVLPLLARLCKTNPGISDLRLLIEFLSYGVFVIDCKESVSKYMVGKNTTAADASLQEKVVTCIKQHIQLAKCDTENQILVYSNVAFVMSYLRHIKSKDEQLYHAAAAPILSALFNLDRDTLPWPDVFDSLSQ